MPRPEPTDSEIFGPSHPRFEGVPVLTGKKWRLVMTARCGLPTVRPLEGVESHGPEGMFGAYCRLAFFNEESDEPVAYWFLDLDRLYRHVNGANLVDPNWPEIHLCKEPPEWLFLGYYPNGVTIHS